MKKFIIIAALLATSTTYTFAEDFFTISGKKVSLHEQRSSMIAKFGKPTDTSVMGVNWTFSGKTISTSFDKWGLTELSTGLGSVTVNDRTIVIGVDTPNTIKSKLGNFCYQTDSDITGKNMYITGRVGAEGEINLTFRSMAKSEKALVNTPISSVKMSYETALSNPTCNY